MKKIFIALLISLTCFAPSPNRQHRRSKSIAPTNTPEAPANTPVEASPIPPSRSSISLNSQSSFNSEDTEALTLRLEKIQVTHTVAAARIGELEIKPNKEDAASHGQRSFITISLGSNTTPTTPPETPDHIREYIRAQKEEQTVRLQDNKTPSSEESSTTEPLSPEEQEKWNDIIERYERLQGKKPEATTPSISIKEEAQYLSPDS